MFGNCTTRQRLARALEEIHLHLIGQSGNKGQSSMFRDKVMTYWNSFDNNEIVDNKKHEIQQASVPHDNVEHSDKTKLSSPNT